VHGLVRMVFMIPVNLLLHPHDGDRIPHSLCAR
jgi:hypothetical protein